MTVHVSYDSRSAPHTLPTAAVLPEIHEDTPGTDSRTMNLNTTTDAPAASTDITFPDDGAPMQRFARPRVRRSASLIHRWIEESQEAADTSSTLESEGTEERTSCHPYLAYPHLSTRSVATRTYSSTSSFVLVNDDERVPSGVTNDADSAESVVPDAGQKASKSGYVFRSPSTLRNFHLNFHARRVSSPSPATVRSSDSQRSTFGRHQQSASTVYTSHQWSARHQPSDITPTTSPRHSWKLKRPSVMDHFTRADAAQSRPSTSSVMTLSSTTSRTRTSTETRRTTTGVVRAPSPSSIFQSAPSLWSLPTNASHIYDPPDSTKVIAKDPEKAGIVRIPLNFKNYAGSMSSFSTMSILASQKTRRKRKLIISGIPISDNRRYEGAVRWCESFGEVHQIVRVPNGDLHVDFKKAEVADTVCRLQARVFIAGVGSVCLSWYTGKRP